MERKLVTLEVGKRGERVCFYFCFIFYFKERSLSISIALGDLKEKAKKEWSH